MEVMMMPQSVGGENFMFNSTCNSPSGSAPQSPQSTACNYYFSAPSSPTNSSPFNRQISFAFNIASNIQALEHQQETIAEKSVFDSDQDDDEEDFTFDFNVNQDEDDDTEAFAFDFSAHEVQRSPPPADHKLSDSDIIKPLVPPPKKTLQNAVSFRHRKKYSNPTSRLMESVYVSNYSGDKKRSLKVSNMVSERPNTGLSAKQTRANVRTTTSTTVSSEDISMERSSSSGLRYVKWKLADLSLFRSTSEGHEANKKYDIYGKNMNEDLKSSSGGRGNTSRLGGGRKKKDQRVAGHELINYNKMNRAAAEEMKRKTYLPYKKNLMGCMNIDSLIVDPSNRRINGSQLRRQS